MSMREFDKPFLSFFPFSLKTRSSLGVSKRCLYYVGVAQTISCVEDVNGIQILQKSKFTLTLRVVECALFCFKVGRIFYRTPQFADNHVRNAQKAVRLKCRSILRSHIRFAIHHTFIQKHSAVATRS